MGLREVAVGVLLLIVALVMGVIIFAVKEALLDEKHRRNIKREEELLELERKRKEISRD